MHNSFPVIKCWVICTTMSSYVIIMYGGFMERMTISFKLIMTWQVGEPEGAFKDLFIFVVDAHVRSSQFHHDISYQQNQPNPKAKAFYDLIDRDNLCMRDVNVCCLFRQQWNCYTSSQVEMCSDWHLMICVQSSKSGCQTTTTCLCCMMHGQNCWGVWVSSLWKFMFVQTIACCTTRKLNVISCVHHVDWVDIFMMWVES